MKRTLVSSIALILASAGAAHGATVQGVQPTPEQSVLWAAGVAHGVGLVTGPLVIVTDNSSQQIEINVGPNPGEVEVFGVDGIPDGQPFTGVTSISLTTGRGTDFVQVNVFAAQAPDVVLNTGVGESDVVVRYDLAVAASPASSAVSITGGRTHDKATFQVFSLAGDVDFNWTVAHGNGDNLTTVVIDSPDASASMDLSLSATAGSGLDTVDVSVAGAPATFNSSFYVRTGAGNDAFSAKFDGIAPSNATGSFNTNLGLGDDVSKIDWISRGGTNRLLGTAAGGDGLDNVLLTLEGDGVNNLRLNGGAGNDYLDAFQKGAVTGSPRLLAGDGDDFLKIVNDGPILSNPILDGGPGFDVAIGFGTFLNIEQIN